MKLQCCPRVKMAVGLCCHLVVNCCSASLVSQTHWPWAGPPANMQSWGFDLLVHYAQHELLNSFGVLFSSVDYVSHPLRKLDSLRTVSPFPSVHEGEPEQLTFPAFVALADMKLFSEVCLSTNWA